jgi:hypothetical protein
MRRDSEVELLSKAIEALRSSTGLSVITRSFADGKAERDYDALLRITRGDAATEYSAILKKHLTSEMLGTVASQIRRTNPQGVLVTHHVTPPQAEKLRRLHVSFFDSAGNAFLDNPSFLIFVSGRRPESEKPKEKSSRAFQPSGLRTLFALLSKPGLELEAYRDIATAAKVSHGTIGWVMGDLEKEGYLIDQRAKGRRLTRKADLVKRWVETFPQQLRPKLLIARYSSKNPDWWTQAHLERSAAYWGGEVAAAKLTQYLRPELKTIYASTNLPEIQAKYALRKDANGDVEILRTFWGFKGESAKNDIVPPLLVYADLMASGDDRNIETAEIIYDTEISRLVGEASTL